MGDDDLELLLLRRFGQAAFLGAHEHRMVPAFLQLPAEGQQRGLASP